ncbi:hypothetical protein [Paraburkholderia ultramafica]|uniref:hypothetical protein n=1 Tax=Paraburkholderia ultramafica TaxID=1544867 RepID=UPI001FE4D9FD|nr:hypothetical protein [Paraburkholderia ultramafica]
MTLAATTLASAAIHRDLDSLALPADATAAASADAGPGDLGSVFSSYGIDPDSNKARIVVAWVEKIRQDPLIAVGIPGGAQRVAQIFLDPAAREELMASGLARLAPADRFRYVQLLTKLLDEQVPVNCFGLLDMRAVMTRVSLREMSESDVEQYFSLLHQVLVSEASHAPITEPTPQQYAAAERQFTRAVITELQGDQADVDRFAFYSSHPSQATPLDVCWATRVALHAIIAMPDPERDHVLFQTIVPHDGSDASSAGQLGTSGKAFVSPAASQSGADHAP